MEFYYHDIDRDVLVITADGGLNRDTSVQFVQSIEKLVEAGLNKIIVDCSKLDYISSIGLGALLRLHQRMKGRGGDVKIAGVSGFIAQALQATRLDRMFSLYPDVDRARLDFRPRENPA